MKVGVCQNKLDINRQTELKKVRLSKILTLSFILMMINFPFVYLIHQIFKNNNNKKKQNKWEDKGVSNKHTYVVSFVWTKFCVKSKMFWHLQIINNPKRCYIQSYIHV